MNTIRKENSKLQGKDLVHIGIFTAIYFVVVFAVAMLGYIPIFIPLLCVLVPIIGGIPFMLFLTKVKKFGMIMIMSIIMGILMLLTGMGYHCIYVGAISGLIAEVIYKSGNYRSSSKAIMTCGFFSIWVWGNFIPFFIDIEGYFATRKEFGQEYADALTSLMPIWMMPTLIIAAFVSGLVGGYLGKMALKKHFKKAGIA
ncbi:MAG: Trep_Strep domain-containing protein [Cellulosilyticum sp.]|nr:Trep_Strep domain-containing protein [Cellulosilyticum sp.]